MVGYDGNELEYPREESDQDRERAQIQHGLDSSARQIREHNDAIRDKAKEILENRVTTRPPRREPDTDLIVVICAAALWVGRKIDDLAAETRRI